MIAFCTIFVWIYVSLNVELYKNYDKYTNLYSLLDNGVWIIVFLTPYMYRKKILKIGQILTIPPSNFDFLIVSFAVILNGQAGFPGPYCAQLPLIAQFAQWWLVALSGL